MCNYNWDYPELVIMLYVNDTNTSLGGFRIPYGLGATLKYNLDNKEVSNYKNGYWTWNLSVVDWSIIKRATTVENDQLMEGLAGGFIYAKDVSVG